MSQDDLSALLDARAELVRDLYEVQARSLKDTARTLEVPLHGLYVWFCERGIHIRDGTESQRLRRQREDQRQQAKIDHIIALRDEGKTLAAIAEQTGKSLQSVWRILDRNGLTAQTKARSPRYDGFGTQRAGKAVLDANAREVIDQAGRGMSISAIARHHGVSYNTARCWLKKENVEVSPRPDLTEKQQRIVAEWHRQPDRVSRVATAVGCAPSYVGSTLRKAGIMPALPIGRPSIRAK